VPVTLRHDQAAFATALGLALRDGDNAFGIDFRRGEFAYHRERERCGAGWHASASSPSSPWR